MMVWMPRWFLCGVLSASLWLLGCPPGDDDAADDDAADDDTADDDDGADDDSAGDDDSGDDDTTPPEDDVYLWPPLQFPSTPLGCLVEDQVAIVNQGDDPVVVSAHVVDPGGEHFELLPPLAWPITIYPGFDLPMEVIFHPQADGDLDGMLQLETDHPDFATVTGEVEGTGEITGEQTDTFVQEGNNQVDLLWVVDNSCSMIEEQQYLADNATAFLDFLVTAGIDYQIGVVTTDSGDLQGAVPIIDSSTKNPAEVFADAVLLGTNGSATEQPFLYAYEAITPPLMEPGGPNDGLIRPDAGLAIVVLTDEPDQSPGDAATWITSFESYKPDPGRVAVAGIYGLTTGCANAYPGPKIHDVIVGTGGTEVSICDVDWLPALSSITGIVSGPASSFPLSQPAVPMTIEVRVDQTPVTSGWWYDGPGNTVFFEFDHIPAPGSDVEIHYFVQGEC
jgi:hypothetical protein